MDICKAAAIETGDKLTGEDLAAINALARRTVKAEEVYTFAVRLCDNDIDRDMERFDDGALEALGKLFVGVPGVFDHQWSAKNQTARIYRTQVVEEGLTSDGRPCRYLKGWAYMMRTGENASLMAEIDGGIKREVSVGCAVKEVVCSVCGGDMACCGHEKGEEYGGKLCHGILKDPTDAYEWSFVAVPAQRKAGVVKGKVREQEAALGRSYLKGLRKELIRVAGIAEPELEHDLLKSVADKLGEEELRGLITLYRGRSDKLLGLGTQLPYGDQVCRKNGEDDPFLI